jgi:hypothetical protein
VHYQVDGFVIRAENAAKPASHASGYVLDLLNQLGPFNHALDYGCGKLRYAVNLAQQSNRLTLVDSDIQLSRQQVVCDETTTVRDYAVANWKARVMTPQAFRNSTARYDFALVANVLSAIPSDRIRRLVVRLIGQRLTVHGCCLFICQYTNSYFCRQMADESVPKYADGYIKGTATNASFYGLIKPPVLRQLVLDCGLAIRDTWINDQSGYVVAERP